jgi:hypothetical protein
MVWRIAITRFRNQVQSNISSPPLWYGRDCSILLYTLAVFIRAKCAGFQAIYNYRLKEIGIASFTEKVRLRLLAAFAGCPRQWYTRNTIFLPARYA